MRNKTNRKKRRNIFIRKKNQIRNFKPVYYSFFISNDIDDMCCKYSLDMIDRIKNDLEKTYKFKLDIVNIRTGYSSLGNQDYFIKDILKVFVTFKRSKDYNN